MYIPYVQIEPSRIRVHDKDGSAVVGSYTAECTIRILRMHIQ